MKLTAVAVAFIASAVAVGADPASSAQAVISRAFGDDVASKLDLQVIPADPATGNDVFELDFDSSSNKVVVRGNSGVAIASGAYQYLQEALHAVVSWGVNRTGIRFDAPPTGPLPAPSKAARVVRATKWSYSWNVCTYGYTAWAWDWARWQEEIDWLALHGVNLPLAFAGQEAVWQQLWTEIGVTADELNAWFSGGAFLPWQRMANIMGWAGPLDDDWINAHRDMQKQILAGMLDLGMTPVLPGFPGHVPPAFKRIYPNASVTTTAPWGNFNSTFTEVPFLEPDDPHFKPLARRFYEISRETFGTDIHAYNIDQFNEMRPRSSNLTFLREANAAVWDSLSSVDNEATFVMQAWLFHDTAFWTPPRVQAYLSGVPTGRMLILDLNSEQSPFWNKFDSYYGHDWIWCALHNYGGKPGMYGNLTRVATGLPAVLADAPNATVRGIGFTPEAILQNPVYYELVTAMSWRREAADPAAFVQDWARRRYGAASALASQAWSVMEQTIYSTSFSWEEFSELQREPTASQPTRWGLNGTASVKALRLLTQAVAEGQVPDGGPLRHDLTDLGSQVLGFFFADVAEYARAQLARYTSGAASGSEVGPLFQQAAVLLQSIISGMDELLATDPSFLMGHWEQMAIASPGTTTPAQRSNRLFNAKNQVTLWGPSGQINDYAAKHWAGLVGDYYGARWSNWTSFVSAAIEAGAKYDGDEAHAQQIALSQAWDASSQMSPVSISGDAPQKVLQRLESSFITANSTVSSAFKAQPNVDYPSNDLFQSGTKDVDQLMLLCNALDDCVGFNSNGWIKRTLGKDISSPGSTFYVKQQSQ